MDRDRNAAVPCRVTAPPLSSRGTLAGGKGAVHHAAGLEINIRSESERAAVEVVGELDITSSRQLQEVLDRLLGRRHVPAVHHLVLDVSAVTFADVAGLSPILHARAVLAHRGGRIELHRPSRLLQRLVRVLGLQDELLAPEPAGVDPRLTGTV